MWDSLVALADRNDRWAIEALGIGAEKNWDRAVTAVVNLLSFPKERTNALWRMMQRSRCKESIESLPTIWLLYPSDPAHDLTRYLSVGVTIIKQ